MKKHGHIALVFEKRGEEHLPFTSKATVLVTVLYPVVSLWSAREIEKERYLDVAHHSIHVLHVW